MAPFSYSPEACQDNARGMVYISLGVDVFKVPYNIGPKVRGLAFDDIRAEQPDRPKPFEPQGCPGNPVWGRSFGFPYRFDPENPYGQSVSDAFVDVYVSVRYISVGFRKSSFADRTSFNKAMFSKYQDFCTEYRDGLIRCLAGKANAKTSPEMWSVYFFANPQDYSTPTGEEFGFSCRSGANYRKKKCTVEYRLDEALGLTYSFYLHNISEDAIIALDKSIQGYIKTIRYQHYEWLSTKANLK